MTTDPAQQLADRHHVSFRTTPGEPPVVVVDDHDIANHISGIQIVADPVLGTRVSIEVPTRNLGRVEFEGLAVVEVNHYSEAPGPAAAVFLSAIDAETLQKAALSRLDIANTPHGTTEAILRQLIEWANGEGGV